MRKVAAAVLLLAGCKRGEPARLPPEPLTVHLVARVNEPMIALGRLDDGTPLLDTRFFVHELRSPGGPILVGDAASYATLLPERNTFLEPWSYRTIDGTRRRIVATDHQTRATWDGSKWTREAAPHADLRGPEGPPGLYLPPRILQREWKRLPDATWVGLVMEESAILEAVVVKPPSTDYGIARIEPRSAHCTFVPSADAHAWITCGSTHGDAARLLRLDGLEWVAPRAQHLPSHGAIAIGSDGTIWYRDADQPLRVRRFDPKGHHDDVAIPDVVTAWPASYRNNLVVPGNEDRPRAVDSLLPLPSGEVWAAVSTTEEHTLVYRIGGAKPPGVAYVGSQSDQRVAAANAAGPVPATGHCSPVFVPLVTARGASFPTERITAKKDSVLGATRGDADVVVGWHGDRRAAGVLFRREDERAIADLIEAFSDDPSAVPRPSCTPPVIERRFDL
jgi:hypothetical protein